MSRTIADLTQEMYEDMIIRREELESMLQEAEEKKDPRSSIMEAITAINRALGESDFVEDALIDKWEAQLEAGEIPNLDEEVET